MRRLAATLLAALLALCATAAFAAPKTLKVVFPVAETGFDPAQINDLYSRTVTPHIFEGLYHYDHLARPAKIRPLTAAAMPEVSADFRRYTIRVEPGMYFADDPALRRSRRSTRCTGRFSPRRPRRGRWSAPARCRAARWWR